MQKVVSKKMASTLLVVLFYLSTSFLGALCASDTQAGHHQKRGMQHSLSCLLACSNLVGKEVAAALLPSVLPFFSTFILSLFNLKPLTNGSILRGRSPPLFS